MNSNKKPLGHSIVENLTKGDLVTWKVWKVEDKKLNSVDAFGIILDIDTEKRTGREIYVAYILRSDSDEIEKINVLRLKKKETI